MTPLDPFLSREKRRVGLTGRQTTGKEAETIAAAWLRRQGYAITAKNVRTPLGEIDLVAQDGNTLCFIEVRARRSEQFGTPEESITYAKQRHMLRAAQWYLQSKRWRDDVPVRLDLITIRWQGTEPQINHLKNIFGG